MVNLTSNGHSLPTQTYNSLKKQTFFGPGSPDVPACGSKFSSVASGAEPDVRLLLDLKILLKEHPISGQEKSWGHYQNS